MTSVLLLEHRDAQPQYSCYRYDRDVTVSCGPHSVHRPWVKPGELQTTLAHLSQHWFWGPLPVLPFSLFTTDKSWTLSQNKQDLTEEHNSQHSLFSPWEQDEYYHSHFTNRERENDFPPALSTQSMAACQEEIPRLLYSCWKSHGHGDKWSCQ